MEPESKSKHFSFGEEALFFLIPIVGLIMYFINVNSNPEKSKYALGISAVGLAIGLFLGYLMFM